MKLVKSLFFICLFSIIIMYISCMMGGTSETGNARTALISGSVAIDTSKQTTALIRLVNEQFIPGTKATDKVFLTAPDARGNYAFDSIPWGNYYVYIKEGSQSQLRGPIDISREQIDIGLDSLHPQAYITLDIPNGTSYNFVYVKGTIEEYTIDSSKVDLTVPSGTITLITASDTIKRYVNQPDSSAFSKAVIVVVKEKDSLKISLSNSPPSVSSVVKDTTIQSGTTYQLIIHATDPENDPIRFSLRKSPSSMKIDSLSGEIVWNVPPIIPDTIIFITAQIADIRGAARSISWTISIVRQQQSLAAPTGPDFGLTWKPYTFSIDSNNHDTLSYYRFSWGDGDTTTWSTSSYSDHTWKSTGTFFIRMQKRANTWDGLMSTWSLPHRFVVGAQPPKATILTNNLFTGDTLSLQIFDCFCIDSSAPLYVIYWGNGDTTAHRNSTIHHTYKTAGTFFIMGKFYCETGNSSFNEVFAIDSIRIKQHVTRDTIAPSLILNGKDTIFIDSGAVFNEPGYSATDNIDSNITSKVIISGTISTHIPGTYTRQYKVSDTAGNTSLRIRTIIVRKVHLFPPTGPDSGITNQVYYFNIDSSQTSDTTVYRFSWGDGDTSSWINRPYTSHVWKSPGNYGVQIQIWNLSGEKSGWSPPRIITISAPSPVPYGVVSRRNVSINEVFQLSIHNCSCNNSPYTARIAISWGNKDTLTTSDTVLNYSYSTTGIYYIDALFSCESSTVIQDTFFIDSIFVNDSSQRDTIPPELTLFSNDSVIFIDSGSAYKEPGYTAIDNVDGDITSLVITNNPVNTSIPGDYTIVYTVTDRAGNTTQRKRFVNVR